MSVSTDRISTGLFKAQQQLSSGKKINSAADDAAGLAISEKMEAEARGWAQGTNNAADMQNLLRTAEGGLSNMSDALVRIRELSIQALNDTNTASDKEQIQKEVSGLLDFVKDSAKGTEFNTMKLLDGSYKDKQAATSPDGSGMKIYLEDTTLTTLGIDGYDVTGNFDLSDIDAALEAVNSARASIGASVNRLEYTINANETSYLNQMQAKSRIADADIGKSMMEKNRLQVLSQYQVFSQQEQMQRMGGMLSLLK